MKCPYAENCPLLKNRNIEADPVYYSISFTTKARRTILFVAEAPGQVEAQIGTILVGKSGTLIRSILRETEFAMKLNAKLAFANAVACRPPNNDTPTEDEIQYCASNLLKNYISFIRPAAIVALGKVAFKSMFYIGGLNVESNLKMTDLMNKDIKLVYNNKEYAEVPIYVTYHPAYVLRRNNVDEYREHIISIIGKIAAKELK